MSDDIAIRVEHVHKAFNLPHEKTSSIKSALIHFGKRRAPERQQVIKGVSFEIKKGEFFGIVGRNGSGKSTLLKLLAGIYSPDKGKIEVNGKLTPFIELGVGFNPELTGRENVFLNGALLGFSRREMQTMYKDIVEFAELERFMDQKLKNYSSGMQVRLAFSVAIRANTDILLIDEVLAVGDQAFQEKCFNFFSAIKKSKKTVIFVTHDMSNVERFCDRVLMVDRSIKGARLVDVPKAIALYNKLNHEVEQSEAEPEPKKRKITNKSAIASISKVELLDKKEKPQRSFNYGDDMTVRVHIKSRTAEPMPIVVGLAFYDSANVNISGPNSRGHSFNTSQAYFDYKLTNIPFNMGDYHLVAGIFDETVKQQYDFVDPAAHFFVNTDQIMYGKVGLHGTWQK